MCGIYGFTRYNNKEKDLALLTTMGEVQIHRGPDGSGIFVDDNFRLCNEVSLIPTPGHTPGHVSVLINRNFKKALITGDFIHHPVQMTKTGWCSSADYDQEEGQKTREALLEKYVGEDILIIGTHFATPTAGYIKRLNQGGYWLDVNYLK